ncbi:MAG: NUDIX hydrolase [Candidatus Cloacimonetes bacterium]|nr:NUDIX hydrolase [Candidatus Cloacimonadota bacterium]
MALTYLDSSQKNPYPTVDIIIYDQDQHQIVLIERLNEPFGWALPGGFVDVGESLEQACVREAKEETNLDCSLLCQLYTYSDPTRDNRCHTISTVFIATGVGELKALDDAKSAQWFSLSDLPSLVFDHKKIVNDFKTNYIHGTKSLFLCKD